MCTDHCDNCKLLIAEATGVVRNLYPLYLGEYKQNGSFNGHPLYARRQMAQIYDFNVEKMISKNLTTYLYFRKKGMSNLVIRNFLVTLKLFHNAKCSLFL